MNFPKLKQRENFEQKFTEFLSIETDKDNTLTWKKDSQIYQEIENYKQEYLKTKQEKASDREFSNSINEDDFAKYLLSQLNEANEPLKKVEQYLNAYLQEACYWAVKKKSDKSVNFDFKEHFVDIQNYLCETKKLLKSYDKDKGVSLFGYAQMRFEKKIEDTIKKETGNVDYRSDWSLLIHVASKSGLKKAFIAERKPEREIEQYLLIDKCHSKIANELRSKTENSSVKLTSRDLERLLKEYNKQRGKLEYPGEELDLKRLKERLSICLKIERAVLVWFCFKELYVNYEAYKDYQESNASNKGNMPKPDRQLYQEIANLYNQRRSRLKYIDSETEAEKVEQALSACIKALRLYRNPEDPINREDTSQNLKPTQEIASSLDVIRGAKEKRTSGDLVDRQWRRQEKIKFKKLVSKAFLDLAKEYQILFKLLYGLNLEQKLIAWIFFSSHQEQFRIARVKARATRLFLQQIVDFYQGKPEIEVTNNVNNLVVRLNHQIKEYLTEYCSTFLELPVSKYYRNKLSESDKATCRQYYQLQWEKARRQERKYWRNSLSDEDYQKMLEHNQIDAEQLSNIQSKLSNELNSYLIVMIQELVGVDTKKTIKLTAEHKQHINSIQLDSIEEKKYSFVDYWICHKSVRH